MQMIDGKNYLLSRFSQVDAYETFQIKRFRYFNFSIDLYSFINKKGHYYTIEEFKFFNQWFIFKKWVH
jgi:hypothetical protein